MRRVRLQMMQTEPLGEQLTTAIADGDSFRYYPAYAGDVLDALQRSAPSGLGRRRAPDAAAVRAASARRTDHRRHPRVRRTVRLRRHRGALRVPRPTSSRSSSAGDCRRSGTAGPGVYSQCADRASWYAANRLADGVWVVTGPGGRGMTLGPAIAEQTADEMGPMTSCTDNDIQLAVIDMAGTTVADDGLVVDAFEAAADAVGVPDTGPRRADAPASTCSTPWASPRSRVFRALFDDEDDRAARQRRVRSAYDRTHRRRPGRSRSPVLPRRSHVCATAASRSRSPPASAATTQDKLLAALGWHDAGRPGARPRRRRPWPAVSRPDPHRAHASAEPTACQSVAALGDTAQRHRKRCCAPVSPSRPGTLTGAHDERRSGSAGATHVVDLRDRLRRPPAEPLTMTARTTLRATLRDARPSPSSRATLYRGMRWHRYLRFGLT